jgi:hypothetical protein
MRRPFPMLLLCLLTALAPSAQGQSQLRNHDFQVLLPSHNKDEITFQTIRGNERTNNSLNRLAIISESQLDYPAPESACGPIALLNTLIWYETYGLIQAISPEADPVLYRRSYFDEIDRRIMGYAGSARDERNGSRNVDIALVLDAIVHQQSGGQLRMHTDYYEAPLRLQDLLQTMPNFRVGYVLGYPIDPISGQKQQLHAMTLIRADRAGYVTLATWGEKYRGLLRMRGQEQWFIPEAPHSVEIQVIGLIRFIPFTPLSYTKPAS